MSFEHLPLTHQVGQLFAVGFPGPTLDAQTRDQIVRLGLGNVVLFERNSKSVAQVRALCAALQAQAKACAMPPMLITIDQEGGVVTRLRESHGFTEWPSMMALGKTRAAEQNVRLLGSAMARELRAVGINLNLAPVLDVNNNPDNPVIGARAFGSDPDLVARLGVALIESLQENGVLACGKHFPGHGDTDLDSHFDLPNVPHTRERLEAIEFAPFRAAIAANVAGIMSSHIIFPAIEPQPNTPATVSSRVLTDLLLGQLGHRGLIFTDSLDMLALTKAGYPPVSAAAAAFAAGADVLCFNTTPDVHEAAHALIMQQLVSGDIPMSRLENALRGIAAAKRRIAGAGAATPLSEETLSAHRALSQRLADETVRVLRDRAGLLPLRGPVLVLEPAGLGLGQRLGMPARALPETLDAAETAALIDAVRGQTVVMCTSDIRRLPVQQDVANLLTRTTKVIGVALRVPYDADRLPIVPTFIAAYSAAPCSLNAVARILRG